MKVKARENSKKEILQLFRRKENIAFSVVSQYSRVVNDYSEIDVLEEKMGWENITDTGFLLDETGYYVSSYENIKWWKEILMIYQVYLDKYIDFETRYGREAVIRVLQKHPCAFADIETVLKHKLHVLEKYFLREEAQKTPEKIWTLM